MPVSTESTVEIMIAAVARCTKMSYRRASTKISASAGSAAAVQGVMAREQDRRSLAVQIN